VLTYSGDDFEHPLSLFEASVDCLPEGAFMAHHLSNLEAALQRCQWLAEVMEIDIHLLESGFVRRVGHRRAPKLRARIRR
jgi:hypothetical protein